MSTNILVVDDEREIADLVRLYLINEGYSVTVLYSGSEALERIAVEQYDLAILDIMLPGVSGLEICQRIRERHHYPVIMLTAKVEDIDKITGLSLGADDYITKPFNPLEVVARVKAQLRRYRRYNAHSDQHSETIMEFDFAGLTINKESRKCTLYGKDLALTPLEFSILWHLCEHRGKVVSSEALFEAVWGEMYIDNNNTVMAHIGRLREKMNESSRNPKFIKTVWGVGYKIE
ncbi:MAG: VanR-ABDEGLN family response regulator transcription factor [Erysipelothrix sp.]|nr:VanR-ABDEGLN family response regulator transcription factor [Erysipelothrix sp.]